MTKMKNNDTTWIDRALETYADESVPQASPDFLDRCRKRALGAMTMHKLKKASVLVGFLPLPFSRYIETVSESVGATLKSVLESLGIPAEGDTSGLDKPTEETIRLGITLGLTLRKLLIHFRLAHLAHAGQTVAQFGGLRTRGGGEGTFMSLVEEELETLEKEMGSPFAAESRKLGNRISHIYEQHSREGD